MKRRVKAITAATAMATFVAAAGAVITNGQAVGDLPRMPGMTDYTPMINLQNQQMLERNIMQNIMDSQELGRSGGQMTPTQARAAIQAEVNRVKSVGAAKIKAGTATTIIVTSVTGTQALAKSATWDDENDPKDLAGQVKYIQRYVRQFETLMLKNGFTPKDYSDCYAFAYALSYAAYNNKDMDRAEVERIRQAERNAGLTNPFFQGASDERKQRGYEMNALMAAQAAEQRALYRQATNEAERAKYDAKAKKYASFMLDDKK